MKIVSIVLAALGGFLFGYNTAVIAGVMLYLKTAFALDPATQGWAVSILLLGALVAAWVAGMLADSIGRKKTILISAVCVVVGCFLAAQSQSLQVFSLGRLITGIGLGIASVVCPMYLSEIASAKLRGTVVAIYQFAITLGILAAYTANHFFDSEESWRWMIALGAIAAGLQLVFFSFLFESPRWLLANGLKTKAKEIAHKLQIRESIEEHVTEKKSRWSELFVSPKIRLALVVGLFLSIFQQITGINAIIYFAPQIFEFAGFSNAESATLATLGIGVFNVFATIIAVWLLDKVGRRILLFVGTAGMAIALISTALAFLISAESIDLLSLFGLMAFVGFFAIGLGPVTWVVIAEIFPLAARAKAISLATLANWLFNYIVSLVFLDVVAWIGAAPIFIIFACLCIICFFFILKFLPETKGRKLSEIQKLF
jgi:SP family galactose:H+ symporter-like MFS transporter